LEDYEIGRADRATVTLAVRRLDETVVNSC
jgi:hypothetical protein